MASSQSLSRKHFFPFIWVFSIMGLGLWANAGASQPVSPKKANGYSTYPYSTVKPSVNDPPSAKTIANKAEPSQFQDKPEPSKLKEGDQFFQELLVEQKPTIQIQGLPVQTFLQYVLLSRFTVEKVQIDGSLNVQQKIEGARLIQADTATGTLLMPALAKLPGTTFKIALNSRREVTRWTGPRAQPQVAHANLLGGAGFQMASLLDADGWKELTERTFFQPMQPLKPGASWSRPMTHSWGPLGSWQGQIVYQYETGQNSMHKFQYRLALKYLAPKGKTQLPIAKPAFQSPQAGGIIFYDSQKAKVVAAQEVFRVRGRLESTLLGQNIPVDIAEEQSFRIRILDPIDPEKWSPGNF